MIQISSRESYKKALETLGSRQREVFEYVRRNGGGFCNNAIKTALGREINQITPRCQELRKLGLLRRVGCYQKCRHSRGRTLHWYANDTFEVKPEAIKEMNLRLKIVTSSQLSLKFG